MPSTPGVPLFPSSSSRPDEPPLDRGLTSRLLKQFDGNPFYHAYRNGFIRLYAGESAAPGSVMAAAIVIVGLIAYRLLATIDPPMGASALLIALTITSVIGACEGLVLGTRALSTERDQSTWPMLVVSGMRPATLLRGKFATAFYALSGEWSMATPFWVLAALSWHPAVALLALVQPAAIALGILFGLWMASQPRYLLISLHSIGLWICGLLGSLWLVREVVLRHPGSAATLAQACNPVRMVNNLASFSTPEGLLQFAAQFALWGLVALVLWNRSDARLQRVLRGE